MNIKDSPALLLIFTGLFLGLTFPFGKLAAEASISPIVWAWLISFGSGIILLISQFLRGRKVCCNIIFIKYYFWSSLFSFAVPNILIFTVIPKLGSGFTGILFTLSPIFTLALSSIKKVALPNRLGTIGILIGFIGAVIVTLTRGEVSQPASTIWLIAGLCIPLSLAVGNLYRTVGWPEGADPIELAVGSNLSAAILLFSLLIFSGQAVLTLDLLSIKSLAIFQVIGSVAMFSIFFRLQQIGGPTYLSQIGYIAAGVALFSGTVFMNEQYSLITWFGAIVIIFGIILSILGQKDPIESALESNKT
ncbi:DMT family transporter [uncultured Ferrimonas sp.]|uniref:DMT family transporter n=1 Tax=uncultured Ferrimonas sp. TaxID=432640 RepID=UPI00261A8DBE|nr:DMT family transporter [uncultured Ferrimonas sp.]